MNTDTVKRQRIVCIPLWGCVVVLIGLVLLGFGLCTALRAHDNTARENLVRLCSDFAVLGENIMQARQAGVDKDAAKSVILEVDPQVSTPPLHTLVRVIVERAYQWQYHIDAEQKLLAQKKFAIYIHAACSESGGILEELHDHDHN